MMKRLVQRIADRLPPRLNFRYNRPTATSPANIGVANVTDASGVAGATTSPLKLVHSSIFTSGYIILVLLVVCYYLIYSIPLRG